MLLNNAILAVKNMNAAQYNGDTPAVHILRKQIAAQFPMTLKVFRLIDADINEKENSKGYYLVKRPHKKHGFLYYVRYIRNGKTVPSMWNTRTNIRETAELFALNNRERIVEEYTAKADGRLFTILGSCYEKGSKHFIDDQNINGKLCEKLRRQYLNFIVKRFIPFLKSQKVYTFAGISAVV